MIEMTWATTPASGSGVLLARPAGVSGACTVAARVPAAVAAPAPGTRVPAARLRALVAVPPFGAGTATDEQHIQNKSTLGIHSPGRPLS